MNRALVCVLLAVGLSSCGTSEAQRRALELWIEQWKGPPPRVAIDIKNGRPNTVYEISKDVCEEAKQPFQTYIDPNAAVRGVLYRKANAYYAYEDRIQVTTTRRGLVYDRPWGSPSLDAACTEVLTQALRVFADEARSAAEAQAGPPPGAAKPAATTVGDRAAEVVAQAKDHARRATQLYDLGKYVDAAKEYEEAFRLSDKAAFLFNIAQAYRLAELPKEALAAYRGFIRRMPDSPLCAEANQHIAEIEGASRRRR